jgi:hypothetical protein
MCVRLNSDYVYKLYVILMLYLIEHWMDLHGKLQECK